VLIFSDIGNIIKRPETQFNWNFLPI